MHCHLPYGVYRVHGQINPLSGSTNVSFCEFKGKINIITLPKFKSRDLNCISRNSAI